MFFFILFSVSYIADLCFCQKLKSSYRKLNKSTGVTQFFFFFFWLICPSGEATVQIAYMIWHSLFISRLNSLPDATLFWPGNYNSSVRAGQIRVNCSTQGWHATRIRSLSFLLAGKDIYLLIHMWAPNESIRCSWQREEEHGARPGRLGAHKQRRQTVIYCNNQRNNIILAKRRQHN